MAEDSFECEKCGRDFDSKRGLSVHKTQKHNEEDENMEENRNEESINLGIRTAMFGVFILGVFVGLSGGLVFSDIAGSSSIENIKAPADSQDDGQEAGSQISGESTMAAVKDIADSVGADGDQVEQCVNSADKEEINEDKSAIVQEVGDMGTPTFFIGNSDIGYTQISGAQPYPRMKPTIDQKLQEAEEGGSVGEEEYALESISFEGEPVMGDESAPINIIEYSDYGCPWCAEWHGTNAIPQRPIDEEESFSKVRSNYVETGDVQFVLKDFPVPSLHPDAMTTHKAANCVLENSPDSFWDFSQKLYEERDKWKS